MGRRLFGSAPGAAGLAVASGLLVAACGTVGSVPEVTMNARAVGEPVQNLLLVVGSDNVPPEFGTTFSTSLSRLLAAHGVRNEVLTVSALDLDAPKISRPGRFDYVLVCTRSHATVRGSGYAQYVNLTMTCALGRNHGGSVLMKAVATANKGFGIGFGRNEAEHLTAELVSQMQRAGLLGAAASQTMAAAFYSPELHDLRNAAPAGQPRLNGAGEGLPPLTSPAVDAQAWPSQTPPASREESASAGRLGSPERAAAGPPAVEDGVGPDAARSADDGRVTTLVLNRDGSVSQTRDKP